VIDGETHEEVYKQLNDAYTDMSKRLNSEVSATGSRGATSNGHGANGASNGFTSIAQPSVAGGFAIILNGHSLVSVFD